MQLNKKWSLFLDSELQSNYFSKLKIFIQEEYSCKTIYPNFDDIFRAFNLINPDEVKVVILGQDPYHGINQANGLAFSVYNTSKIPPSLKNIFKELVNDIGCSAPSSGDLTAWSKDGVLLINTVLTVESGKPNSHKNNGWETFTDAIIKKLSNDFKNIVFILWGNPSQKKSKLINTNNHLILKSSHPSPLSSYRGFFGSSPFSQANHYLLQSNKKTVNWCL